MKKYRYVMCGMFSGTDGGDYEINVPSPSLHDSKEAAMKDSAFCYRFLLLDDNKGPEIAIFESEKTEVIEGAYGKHLKTRPEGDIIKFYTFEEFRAAGGYIRMLKPECKGLGFINDKTDFLDTDRTFEDIFPNMQKQKLYYIDNEAYCIMEVDT